jgi:hypothetical protein
VCTVLVEVTDPAVVRDEGSATDRRKDKRDRFGLQKRLKLEGGGRYKKIEGKRKYWRSWSDLTEGRVVCVRRARSQHATERAAAVAAPVAPAEPENQPENAPRRAETQHATDRTAAADTQEPEVQAGEEAAARVWSTPMPCAPVPLHTPLPVMCATHIQCVLSQGGVFI